MYSIYMTKIINSINIKINEKKSKKRKNKKRNVRTHQNAPYSNVASLITNRPQQLDMSTASNREKENIISNAINTVKREKEILTIKDKEPEKTFESPKPKPTELQPKTPKRITDFYSKTPDNNLYNVYPKKETVKYDRVEELGDVRKGKGRPVGKQKANETTDHYIDRIKKTVAYKSTQPDYIPPPPRSKVVDSIPPRSPFVNDILHNLHDTKNDDISTSLKKTQALHKKHIIGIQTRAQKQQEQINHNFKMNQMEGFL